MCLFEVQRLGDFHTSRTERETKREIIIFDIAIFLVVVIKALQLFCNNHYLCFSQTTASDNGSSDCKAVFTMTESSFTDNCGLI